MAEFVEKRTSAPPKAIEGVTFHCYRTGIGRYRWRSEDSRIEADRNFEASTYWSSLDGSTFKTRFRSMEAAMRHAITVMRARAKEVA